MGRNAHVDALEVRLNSVKARFLVILGRFAHNLSAHRMGHVRIERVFGQNRAFSHPDWLVRLARWPKAGLEAECGMVEGRLDRGLQDGEGWFGCSPQGG